MLPDPREMLAALQALRTDLDNDGEVYGSDESRIEMITAIIGEDRDITQVPGSNDYCVERLTKNVDEPFSIVLDHAPLYPIVPNIISQDQEELADADSEDVDKTNTEVKAGRIEYMVSNGFPGQRSYSSDVYNWDDAVTEAKRLQQEHQEDKERRGMP